jgi:hypothetical protein
MIEHNLVVPREFHATRISCRLVVYLDSNVWIDLVEGKTKKAVETLELARLAQRSGTAIFPLSYPAITEFLRQQVNETSRRQGHIMDDLSECVSLRDEASIRDLEILGIYEYMMTGEARPRSNEVFTATMCYLGDGSLEYPENCPPEMAEDMTRMLKPELLTVGVGWLQEHLDLHEFRARYAEGDAKWLDEVVSRRKQALAVLTNADGSLSAKKLRLEEHAYVLREYILKRLPSLVGLAALMLASRRLGQRSPKGSPAVLARGVESMPSVWLGCEMHVQHRLARGKVERQDQFDHDHALWGVPYADAFATADSGLLELLRRCGADKRYKCRLLRGIHGLHDYLTEILDARTVR